MICFHLESRQCGALVCEGPKGLEHADYVTGEGFARPYLCGCPNGARYWGTGSSSSNIGAATTITHRAEKQRLLECFIMEHSLIATNTFSTDDASFNNICTCNYNGCHDSQQIDYILSSDHSLRSRTFDSSATASDHWGLTATIRERESTREKTRQETNWMGMQQ